ncbi:4-alpha-glucanotransferase [Achromobacter aegrifaciens]|uniref:4-alpha-glucanotransferase n=1 Tax=Achromobacter aegrifaciens TaxID=1287736 RepID=A0AAD2J019_ACHAE|nr:4-alpha-glucanotransferase [Achromobacter aegrifaciens]CUJ13411.1 4-alpha-glucanotransferase [Achromobacter aegrifaciens]
MTATSAGDPALSALAAKAGIAEHWTDARQRPQQVSPDTLRLLLEGMGLPAGNAHDIRDSDHRLGVELGARLPPLLVARSGMAAFLPACARGRYRIVCESGQTSDGEVADDGSLIAPQEPGYHTLHLACGQTVLAVAPRQAPGLDDLTDGVRPRGWGLCAQVYSLRRDADQPGDGGYGDFGAVRELAVAAAAQGADALAISPVHAMFAAQPQRCSPYSPSSRLFLNTLYADPAAIVGDDVLRRALAELAVQPRPTELIDWSPAGIWRQRLLRALHRQFRTSGPADARQRYEAYCAWRGKALRDHAVFEALHAAQAAHGADHQPWTQWAAGLRDPDSPEVERYARQHPVEVDFHRYAQWLAAESLDHAQKAARRAGMRVGLIADLAVGDSPDGSHAWSRQTDLMPGLSIGAPPDIHNPQGQNWNLAAFSPRAMHAQGYAAYIDMLRAALAHAGGLRIDHILGMARLWLVPDGLTADAGAYLRYPLRELLALTALEAWRHRALAIGENLGTVPEGFNRELADHGILGMNVLWFMRQEPDAPPSAPSTPAPFLAAGDWPGQAVAMTSTHDLPTLRGWWAERDIDLRAELDLLGGGDDEATLRRNRRMDRSLLAQALGCAAEPARAPLEDMLRFVSSSPCPLLLVPMEDLAGELEQPNLPGTVDQHPNWRQRLAASSAACFAAPAVQARLQALRTGRGRP